MPSSPNKFATALHRSTNRITLVLFYALLEWILIAFLLANSLFSYLILCFADYFGLHPPCPLCSSLEHLFRPWKGKTVSLCRYHLEGVSRGREPTGLQDTGDDRPSLSVGFRKHVPEIGLTSWTECPHDGKCDLVHPPEISSDDYDSQTEVFPVKNGVRDNWAKEEEGEEEEWGEFTMVNVGVTEDCKQVRPKEEEEGFLSPESESSIIVAVASRENDKDYLGTREDSQVIVEHDKNVIAMIDSSLFSPLEHISSGMDQRKDQSSGSVPQHLEFYIGIDESELIPVDLKERYTVGEDDLQNFGGDVILELCMPADKQCEAAALESAPTYFHEIEADYSQEMKVSIDALCSEMAKDNVEEDHVLEKAVIAEEETKAPVLVDDLQELGDATAQFENSQNNPAAEEKEMVEMVSSREEDSDVEVSIGTEIPDHETIDEVSAPEDLTSFEDNHKDASAVYDLLQSEPCNIDESGCVQSETETLEFKTVVVEMCELRISRLQQMCKDSELNHEMEEDKIPDTPGSTDSFDIHSNLMLLGDRIVENEGLIEGSLVGDMESGEEDPTIEQLKEALKTERRSLHALYAELEEERNASAVAASQTMAMINRLQEEKAAMQMEAVQYQRMMEEQSEYDQEALQLLNDLVVKTEKEKEELARELEAYRQRVEEYEARDDMMTPGANKARLDSEYREAEDVDGDEDENTPCDAITCLEESLEDFEEERVRILEHIKSLEEKLVSVVKDEDGPQFEDVQTVASWPGNGNGDSNHLTNSEAGKEVSKHRSNGILGAGKAKRLLPLFDETTDEDEEEDEKNEKEEERLAVEEELDYVYERLDALEADGEFLRHCMGSITKGDKGLDILREILQYLRDMRSFRD